MTNVNVIFCCFVGHCLSIVQPINNVFKGRRQGRMVGRERNYSVLRITRKSGGKESMKDVMSSNVRYLSSSFR